MCVYRQAPHDGFIALPLPSLCLFLIHSSHRFLPHFLSDSVSSSLPPLLDTQNKTQASYQSIFLHNQTTLLQLLLIFLRLLSNPLLISIRNSLWKIKRLILEDEGEQNFSICISCAVPHSKVMEMAEIPKLDLLSSSSSPYGYNEAMESEQKNMGTQRISVSDHINAFQYTPDKADSFVIDMDMDAFSSGINKDTTNASSRTALQRSLSRKGSQRGVDRKVNGNATLHDKDTVPATCSPRGSCTPEKAAVVSTDHSMNPHVHHQITITASNTESSRCITRRNSFRRSFSWGLDPKRVLLFFATLSSMGTMLLIYFTLTISKQNADEYGGD